MRKIAAVLATIASSWAVVACNDKGTLDRTQVEYVTVAGRRYEVRISPAIAESEYRMLVVRATLVINPDPGNEHERNLDVAGPFMKRTCKGRPYQILEDNLADDVNLYLRFRCQA